MTTVAVTMSVFNGASTVGQALASIVSQTRMPDQVVVVDDGSSDHTLRELERWSAFLPLTIVRHATNRGLGAGRTSAIREITTEAVLALDCDDVWLPSHLALMVAAYQEHGGIVSPMAVEWDPTGARPVQWTRWLQPPPRTPGLRALIRMNWLFSGSMFPVSAFAAAGDTYRFGGCDDWDLWLRLVRLGVPMTTLDQPSVLYRVHAGNMSALDRLLPQEIEVLETFIRETDQADLRSIARRSIRQRRGRQRLQEAYALARDQRSRAARRAAVGALQGSLPVQIRGVGMLLSPRAVTRQRDQRSWREASRS